jgi:hypothetical protein
MKKIIILCLAAAAITAHANEYIRHKLVSNGQAESFRMIAEIPQDFNLKPLENSNVRFIADKDAIRFIVTMIDNDLISEATKDQARHYQQGDALQIFIKPANDCTLWEFSIASNGKKGVFIHSGAGAMFYDFTKCGPEFSVKHSFSKGLWTAEITIPYSVFKEKGFDFTKNAWHFSVVRHNVSRNLPNREISSYPQGVKNASDPRFFGELVF